MLENRPLCVCEITEILGLAPSTVSKHLTILKNADLIKDKKTGRWVTYELANLTANTKTSPILDLLRNNLVDDGTIKKAMYKLTVGLRF